MLWTMHGIILIIMGIYLLDGSFLTDAGTIWVPTGSDVQGGSISTTIGITWERTELCLRAGSILIINGISSILQAAPCMPTRLHRTDIGLMQAGQGSADTGGNGDGIYLLANIFPDFNRD